MSTISLHLPVNETAETGVATEQKPMTMRDAQLRMVPLSAVLVFLITAIGSYVTSGQIGEAIGVGAFMAFWIGGGFGAIMGGALWTHHNEATLYNS